MTRDLQDREKKSQGAPIAREELIVGKREVRGATTRVDVVTHERPAVVDEPVRIERVEVQRVPVDRVVATAPEVRRDGDVTVIPVVEEEIVIERRLRLKEEVRIWRVVEERRHRETAPLREQKAVVTERPPASDEDR